MKEHVEFVTVLRSMTIDYSTKTIIDCFIAECIERRGLTSKDCINKYVVYLIKFTDSGSVYVGKSTRGIVSRLREHYNTGFLNYNSNNSIKFYDAFYHVMSGEGGDFNITVIPCTKYTVDEVEANLIAVFDTVGNGLNSKYEHGARP